MNGLQGKVVVVTGAAGGIGQPLCRQLAAEGCRLGLLSRSADKLTPLADELRQTGAAVSAHAVDVTDRTAMEQALRAVAQEIGSVDIFVHNAGLATITNAREPDLDQLESFLKVNYLGGVYGVAALLPDMLARGSGQIVAISSISALRGLAWTAAYSASKAALAIYLESLRPALARRGIRVTTVYPGFIRTPMSEALPFRGWVPMLRPETAARRIVKAIRAGRREYAFPWLEAGFSVVLRRLPTWAFDALMAYCGRFMLKGEY